MLRVRVADHEVHALQVAGDHVADGVAAGAAHPDDSNLGAELVEVAQWFGLVLVRHAEVLLLLHRRRRQLGLRVRLQGLH